MSADMTRVQAIWQHPLYQKHLTALTRLESDRIFCRHTPEHFLDVCVPDRAGNTLHLRITMK